MGLFWNFAFLHLLIPIFFAPFFLFPIYWTLSGFGRMGTITPGFASLTRGYSDSIPSGLSTPHPIVTALKSFAWRHHPIGRMLYAPTDPYSVFIMAPTSFAWRCHTRAKKRPSIYRGENGTYELFFFDFCVFGICKYWPGKEKKFLRLFTFFCKSKKIVGHNTSPIKWMVVSE